MDLGIKRRVIVPRKSLDGVFSSSHSTPLSAGQEVGLQADQTKYQIAQTSQRMNTMINNSSGKQKNGRTTFQDDASDSVSASSLVQQTPPQLRGYQSYPPQHNSLEEYAVRVGEPVQCKNTFRFTFRERSESHDRRERMLSNCYEVEGNKKLQSKNQGHFQLSNQLYSQHSQNINADFSYRDIRCRRDFDESTSFDSSQQLIDGYSDEWQQHENLCYLYGAVDQQYQQQQQHQLQPHSQNEIEDVFSIQQVSANTTRRTTRSQLPFINIESKRRTSGLNTSLDTGNLRILNFHEHCRDSTEKVYRTKGNGSSFYSETTKNLFSNVLPPKKRIIIKPSNLQVGNDGNRLLPQINNEEVNSKFPRRQQQQQLPQTSFAKSLKPIKDIKYSSVSPPSMDFQLAFERSFPNTVAEVILNESYLIQENNDLLKCKKTHQYEKREADEIVEASKKTANIEKMVAEAGKVGSDPSFTNKQRLTRLGSESSSLSSIKGNPKQNKHLSVPFMSLILYCKKLKLLCSLFKQLECSANESELKILCEHCQSFIEMTADEQSDLDTIDLLFKDEKFKKIIKQSMMLERVTIVITAQNLLNKEGGGGGRGGRGVFKANLKYLKSIVFYAYQNNLSMITIIYHKIQRITETSSSKQSQKDLKYEEETKEQANKQQIQRDMDSFESQRVNISSDCVCLQTSSDDLTHQSEIAKEIKRVMVLLPTFGSVSVLKEKNSDEIIFLRFVEETALMKDLGTTAAPASLTAAPNYRSKQIVELLNVIKQNNEISLSLMKTLSKNDKEFSLELFRLIRQVDRKTSLSAAFHAILTYFSHYLALNFLQDENSSLIWMKFLSTAPAPYLPPLSDNSQYTLVLDLDETLIHCTETQGNVRRFATRPYVQTFLQQVSQYYEIVVFTAGMPDYADWVIDSFDQKRFIKHRLYRHHTTIKGNTHIKDLRRIGRDQSKVIIVDNLSENFQLQPDNGISVLEWNGDPADTSLVELLPLLKEIAMKGSDDVRDALRSLKRQIQQNIETGEIHPHLNLRL